MSVPPSILMKKEQIHGTYRELYHVMSGARENTICTGVPVLLSDHNTLSMGGSGDALGSAVHREDRM